MKFYIYFCKCWWYHWQTRLIEYHSGIYYKYSVLLPSLQIVSWFLIISYMISTQASYLPSLLTNNTVNDPVNRRNHHIYHLKKSLLSLIFDFLVFFAEEDLKIDISSITRILGHEIMLVIKILFVYFSNIQTNQNDFLLLYHAWCHY